jgi:hypothetical protein
VRVPDKLILPVMCFVPLLALIVVALMTGDTVVRVVAGGLMALVALAIWLLVRRARRRRSEWIAGLALTHPGWTILPMMLAGLPFRADFVAAGVAPRTRLGLLAFGSDGVEMWVHAPRPVRVSAFGWRQVRDVREQHLSSVKGQDLRGIRFGLVDGTARDLLPVGIQAFSDGAEGDPITDLAAELRRTWTAARTTGRERVVGPW